MERTVIVAEYETRPDGFPVAVIFIDVAARCNTYKRLVAVDPRDNQAILFTACMN